MHARTTTRTNERATKHAHKTCRHTNKTQRPKNRARIDSDVNPPSTCRIHAARARRGAARRALRFAAPHLDLVVAAADPEPRPPGAVARVRVFLAVAVAVRAVAVGARAAGGKTVSVAVIISAAFVVVVVVVGGGGGVVVGGRRWACGCPPACNLPPYPSMISERIGSDPKLCRSVTAPAPNQSARDAAASTQVCVDSVRHAGARR